MGLESLASQNSPTSVTYVPTVQAEIQHVRFNILKAAAGWLLTHHCVGYWLGILFANKIPVHGGLTIDTTFGESNSVKAALFWGLYKSAEMRFIRRFLRLNRHVVELAVASEWFLILSPQDWPGFAFAAH